MNKPKHEMEFMREQTNFIKSLPPHYQDALLLYTSPMYSKINNFLHGNTDGIDETDTVVIKDTIDIIDHIFSMAPKIKHSLTIYRGLNMPNIVTTRRGNAQPIPLHGLQGKYKGFLSGSTHPTIAANFVRDKCCLLQIKIPKHSRVLFISPISQFSYENEVLLPRNSTINVSGFDDYFVPLNNKIRKIIKTHIVS